MDMPPDQATYDKTVWKIVWQIPRGKVTTYGQIASMIPVPEGIQPPSYDRIAPRWVGYAMNRAMSNDINVHSGPHGESIPWHRVINAKGGISLQAGSFPAEQQRIRLGDEGVVFDDQDLVDLNIYGWAGPDDTWLEQHGLLKPRPLKKSPPPANNPNQLNLF